MPAPLGEGRVLLEEDFPFSNFWTDLPVWRLVWTDYEKVHLSLHELLRFLEIQTAHLPIFLGHGEPQCQAPSGRT
jgi:hypothetical protein